MKMKRIIAERTGGPDVLRLVEERIPEPDPDEVRVKVLAAGVAFGDLLWMSGVVPGSPKPPFTPGYDFVGLVDKLGEGVKSLAVGQRVAALVRTGGYAEYNCWPVESLTPLGDDLDPAQVICLTLNYITAYALITRVGKLNAGGRLLVHGARADLRWSKHRNERRSLWQESLLARRPTNVVLVAMPNKTARVVWAMLRRGETFQTEAPAA